MLVRIIHRLPALVGVGRLYVAEMCSLSVHTCTTIPYAFWQAIVKCINVGILNTHATMSVIFMGIIGQILVFSSRIGHML